MRQRPRWALLTLGAILVVLLYTYPTWRTLITGRRAERPFALASDAQREVFNKMKPPGIAATAYTALLTRVPIPTGTPTPVLPGASFRGQFVTLDAVRKAAGTVRIYRMEDDNLVLSLEDNFEVTNAPDLVVILSGNDQPKIKDDLDVRQQPFFKIGALKGSFGLQQFKLDKSTRIDRFKSVVIYSESLQLIYSYATLI